MSGIVLPLSIGDWGLRIDDLLTIRGLPNCAIRLRIRGILTVTIGGITIVDWGLISHRHFSGSLNQQCRNRQLNAAILQSAIRQ
jgi:hypothetical protein